MKKIERDEVIMAEQVKASKWGYVCPECSGTLLPDDQGDQFDKLDKQAYMLHDCDKCGAQYSALYQLVSLQKEEN